MGNSTIECLWAISQSHSIVEFHYCWSKSTLSMPVGMLRVCNPDLPTTILTKPTDFAIINRTITVELYQEKPYLRNNYLMFWDMVNRRKQSWLRWRHRHDSCSSLRPVPSHPICSRFDASAVILNRCFFIGTLLEAVASPKHLAPYSRSHCRHSVRKFHLKRYIR